MKTANSWAMFSIVNMNRFYIMHHVSQSGEKSTSGMQRLESTLIRLPVSLGLLLVSLPRNWVSVPFIKTLFSGNSDNWLHPIRWEWVEGVSWLHSVLWPGLRSLPQISHLVNTPGRFCEREWMEQFLRCCYSQNLKKRLKGIPYHGIFTVEGLFILSFSGRLGSAQSALGIFLR